MRRAQNSNVSMSFSPRSFVSKAVLKTYEDCEDKMHCEGQIADKDSEECDSLTESEIV